MKALLGALAIFCVMPICAPAEDSPLSLFIAGRFAQAEAAGIAENDADGFALAARAALAQETMRSEPCLECLKRIEELSRRAIAADPAKAEARIYLAATIGYEARIIGVIAAQTKGYATEAKTEIDAALASDPNDVWALAARGSWNIEIVHNAGATLANWLFGAKFEVGQEDYTKAFAVAPDNIFVHYQYALTLASYDLADYRRDIENALTRAIEATPDSAYDSFVQARAKILLEAVEHGNPADAGRLVRHDQGYPDSG